VSTLMAALKSVVYNGKLLRFREAWRNPQLRVNWFPGHMLKSLDMLRDRFLPQCNLIVEVRDCRLPLSSINPKLDRLIETMKKRRIVIYTKIDLLPPKEQRRVKNFVKLHNEWRLSQESKTPSPTAFFDVTDKKNRYKILRLIEQQAKVKKRKAPKEDEDPTTIAVVGVPNVGKSSIINLLKKKKALQVADRPGVTRHITNVRITNRVYLMDSPGIFAPAVEMTDPHGGMKFAATSAVPEAEVGVLETADYLLFSYNQRENFSYMEKLGLREPTDDINIALSEMVEKDGRRCENTNNAADKFLRLYRTGRIPNFVFDDMLSDEFGFTCEQLDAELFQEGEQRLHSAKVEETLSDDEETLLSNGGLDILRTAGNWRDTM